MAIRSRMLDRTFNRLPEPMSQLNITPLIDVMLVLLVMVILSVPVAVHRIDVDLPNGTGCEGACPVYDEVSLVVLRNDAVLWNGEPVSSSELDTRLARAAAQTEAPLIRFEPEANAGYDASVRVINAVADARLDRFAFVGNERYREWDAD